MNLRQSNKSHFRYVRQRDAMHCGVACLSMACSAMGRHVDLYAIEEHCSPTMQGVSLKGMADAAKAIGLKADPARIPPEYLLQKDIGPVILH